MGSETSRRKARELISSLCGSAVNCENCIDRVATTLSAQEEQIERLTKVLTCLWIIADDDHPEYPGEHGIDTVLKMVRAELEGSKR